MSPTPSKQETGQGLVEYALVVVLVGIAFISGLMLFGPSISDMFVSINSSLPELNVGGIVVVINPTPIPTIASTLPPTIAPTIEPTLAPTLVPTLIPTLIPTMEPTIEPTPTDIPWYCVYFPRFCGLN